MKGFAQYLNEAEEHSPLSLNEAIEWFGVFYEELDDEDRSFVIDNLTEEDLYNILWLEDYLEEDLRSGLRRQSNQRRSLSKKMQGRNLGPDGKPIKIQPYQRTYHGTSETGSKSIDRGGWKDDVNVTRQMRGKGVYTTSDKDVASRYAKDRSAKFDSSPGEGKVRTFKVPKGQLPPERMTYQGVGDPKNKGYKTYLLNTQQAGKFDVTNDPKEFARKTGKKLLKNQPPDSTPGQSSGSKQSQPPKNTGSKPPVTSSGFTGPNQTIPGQPNAPTKQSLKQSVKNFGSNVKSVAGKVYNAPETIGTKVGTKLGTAANKQLQKVPGVRKAQAANLKMNRKIAQQTSKLTSKLPQGVKGFGSGALKFASKAATPVDAALRIGSRKMSGQSWKRSIAGGAAETGGGLAGAATGAAIGSAILPGVGTLVGGGLGYMAGSRVAGKAFDTVAGKTPQQLKADQVKNRQRQSGGALTGIGGKTTFDTKKNTMTTGAGSQRKTVKLASTSVVKDPTTGKLDTGYLAYKGGKAVYKRVDKPGTGTTNPWERIGRTLNPSAYKQSDELKRQQNLRIASQNDIKRQQALGVKGSQNLVGPKIVGSPTGYKPAGGGMGGRRGGRK